MSIGLKFLGQVEPQLQQLLQQTLVLGVSLSLFLDYHSKLLFLFLFELLKHLSIKPIENGDGLGINPV